MGKLRVTSNSQLSMSNVFSLNEAPVIGNAAILAIGAPNPNVSPGVGQDVEVIINQNITLNWTGRTNFGLPLPLRQDPPGFRPAH